MSYREELNRLQKIITSDSSSEEQRDKARAAKKKLIDNAIEQAFAAIEKRTQEYKQFVDKLKDIIDNIAANRLTTVMEDLDNLLKDIENTVKDS
jgi:coenzyme F420-reducing hydrogenase alpha subunit